MNDIDKWCAEQCGVNIIYSMTDYPYWNYKGVNYEYDWTITDPQCREIVRERFRILTSPASNSNLWVSESRPFISGKELPYPSKTIAEAEIACITAIYEARDE